MAAPQRRSDQRQARARMYRGREAEGIAARRAIQVARHAADMGDRARAEQWARIATERAVKFHEFLRAELSYLPSTDSDRTD